MWFSRTRQAAIAFVSVLLGLCTSPTAHAQSTATPVDRIHMLPGFQAELLYSVPSESEGSWVNLCVDNKGRLITSDQYGKLYRITVPAIGGKAEETKVEPIQIGEGLSIGMAQGLLYAF